MEKLELARYKEKDADREQEERVKRKIEAARFKAEEDKRADEKRRERYLLEEEEEKRAEKQKRERYLLEEEEQKRAEKQKRERYLLEEEEHRRAEEKKRDRILFEAKLKEEEEKEKQKKLKEKIVSDWQREQDEKKRKEKAKKEEDDEKFEERVKKEFMAAGYSESHIETILHKKREKRDAERKENSLALVDLSRPTYIKVNRKYLSPETLDRYQLPWEWDSKDSTYIIIKRYISHDFQEELFEHTKMLKEKKLIMPPIEKTTKTITTLKVRDGKEDKDEMFLVRSKSKSGRSKSRDRRNSWLFT